MKKIGFITHNLDNNGGTERVGTQLANYLANEGYSVLMINITGGQSPFFALNANIKNISLFSKPGRSLYRTPAIIYKLRKVLKQEKVDITIDIDAMKVLFTLPASRGLPITTICWEHFNFKNNEQPGRALSRKLAALFYNHIVTLTERDKGYWLEGTKNNSQIVTIPNPSPFIPNDYNYTNKAPSNTVIAVGHLFPVKGFDLLLQAWNKVIKHKKDWKLIIVGEGEKRQKLEAYIKDNNLQDNVYLPGKTSNIEKYYQEADILCLTSLFEGLPMVLIEAISYGLPVVSFDCETGPAEILEGTGSILVPQGDIDEFALSLIYLMNNEKERQSISAMSKKKSQAYSPSVVMKQWINLIES